MFGIRRGRYGMRQPVILKAGLPVNCLKNNRFIYRGNFTILPPFPFQPTEL